MPDYLHMRDMKIPEIKFQQNMLKVAKLEKHMDAVIQKAEDASKATETSLKLGTERQTRG